MGGGGDVFWKNNSFLWLPLDALDELSEFVELDKLGGLVDRKMEELKELN